MIKTNIIGIKLQISALLWFLVDSYTKLPSYQGKLLFP